MARPKLVLLPLVATSLATVLSLFLHLQGILLLWKIYEVRRNNSIFASILRKRSYFLRKLKQRKQRLLRRKMRNCWYKPGRTDLWWQNIWNGVAPEECWKKNFRMTRNSFLELVDKLKPYISPNPKSPNYRAMPVEKKVAVTLYFLKDTGTLGMTANSFGIAICSASAAITEVCHSISSHLGSDYLHLPRDKESMRRKVSEFEAKFGMTQAFGCIDGTHIPIKCPSENSHDYFCYKQFYSLSVQAVCDYRGYFMDVECIWPGSVHDAKVFANSAINAKLRSSKLPTTYQTPIPGGAQVPNYLIGDPAYPLIPYCMKEYETCVNNEQVVFNNMLRSARNPIECAFGRLKARWSILTRKVDFKLEEIPFIIYACFVLHNFCEKHNMYIDEDVVNSQIQHMRRNEAEFVNTPDPIFSCSNDGGHVVRKTLTDLVLQNL